MLTMLFVYGTLMDDGVVAQLTGRRFAKTPARLEGYRRLTPPGGYPVIVPAAGASVDGLVLRGIDADALRVFDQYEDEGRLYRRLSVTVIVDGTPQEVQVYAAV
jgi:gamma-glutamylcyclotransferase (GGCT)/AIG2-like uncharacterized protein YtfP